MAFGGLAALATAIGITATALQKPTADPRSFASESTLNRLAVRQNAEGRGEFYDIVTLKPVLLRGNTYQRLANLTGNREHSNFIPSQYDRARAEAALKLMKAYGYNSVRVFVNEDRISTATGLDNQYIANMVDYINLAKSNNIYVLIMMSTLPHRGVYTPVITDTSIWQKGIYNTLVLMPQAVDLKKKYLRDVVSALKNQGASMDAIMGFGVANELVYDLDKLPFTSTQKVIKTANGKEYNTVTQREAMMDESLVYYVDSLRQAIRDIEPLALVGVAFYSPAHASSTQTVRTDAVFYRSNADFQEIHIYPGFFDYAQEIATFKLPPVSKRPLILGEYGAYPHKYDTIQKGGAAVRDLQVNTCKAHFSGWFYYDWDTTEAEYENFRIYHAVEDTFQKLGNNGYIAKMLSPNFRTDPCLTAPPTPKPSPTPTAVLSVSTQCGVNKISDQCISKTGTVNMTVATTSAPSKVLFATWNEFNGLDDLAKYYGNKVGTDTWSYKISASNHTGTGPLNANLWTFNSEGKQEWCARISVPICQ